MPGLPFPTANSSFHPSAAGGAGWHAHDLQAVGALFPEWQVRAFIGRGAVGAVYRVFQPVPGREVAVKLLPQAGVASRRWLEAFGRDVASLVRLRHPGLVSVHDAGFTTQGHVYVVMERVAGGVLSRLISGGGLDRAQGLRLFGQVCDAVGHAHSEGFLHGCLHAGNVLVDLRGQVHVVDVGLGGLEQACAQDGLAAAIPLSPGRAACMAPEQRLAAGQMDARADVYSLGALLHEMLTGKPATNAAVVETGDARLNDVIRRAMQPRVEERFGSVTALREGLAQALVPPEAERAVALSPPVPTVVPAPAQPPRPAAVATAAPRVVPRAAAPASELVAQPESKPEPAGVVAPERRMAESGAALPKSGSPAGPAPSDPQPTAKPPVSEERHTSSRMSRSSRHRRPPGRTFHVWQALAMLVVIGGLGLAWFVWFQLNRRGGLEAWRQATAAPGAPAPEAEAKGPPGAAPASMAAPASTPSAASAPVVFRETGGAGVYVAHLTPEDATLLPPESLLKRGREWRDVALLQTGGAVLLKTGEVAVWSKARPGIEVYLKTPPDISALAVTPVEAVAVARNGSAYLLPLTAEGEQELVVEGARLTMFTSARPGRIPASRMDGLAMSLALAEDSQVAYVRAPWRANWLDPMTMTADGKVWALSRGRMFEVDWEDARAGVNGEGEDLTEIRAMGMGVIALMGDEGRVVALRGAPAPPADLMGMNRLLAVEGMAVASNREHAAMAWGPAVPGAPRRFELPQGAWELRLGPSGLMIAW